MGRKYGNFVNAEGDSITVTFFGESVGSGALEIVSAQLQMDGGGGKPDAVKYTTASITVVTRAMENLDLATTDPLGIEVEIAGWDNQVLFSGYVTPNTLNQPIDGVADTLTIECADYLGIAQYVPYTREGNVFRALSIADAVKGIVARVSGGRAKECYMADNVVIVSGSGKKSTQNYPSIELSEAYFYEEPAEPAIMNDGTLDVSYNAISCYDALAMIAETLQASWVQIGENLYLLDYLMLTGDSGLMPAHAINAGNTMTLGVRHTLDANMFAGMGSNVTLLPRCSEVSMSRTKGSMSLMPELSYGAAKRGNVLTEGVEIKDNKTTLSYAQLLSSPVFDIQREATTPAGDVRTACLVAYKEDTIEGVGTDDLLLRSYYDDGSGWNVALRLYVPGTAAGASSIALRQELALPTVASGCYAVKFSCQVATSWTTDRYSPVFNDDDPNITGVQFSMMLECGGMYYDAELNKWQSNPVRVAVMSGSGDSGWKEASGIYYLEVPKTLAGSTISGPLNISILGLSASPDSKPRALYIKDLKIELAQDHYADLAESHYPTPKTMRRGVRGYLTSPEEVELPMSFGFPAGDKPLSTVIDGEDYAERVGFSKEDPQKPFRVKCTMDYVDADGVKYDALDRVLRLNNIGDGRELQFTLKDEHNLLGPLHSYKSVLWAGTKAVMAFEKNLYNSTIQVTLN